MKARRWETVFKPGDEVHMRVHDDGGTVVAVDHQGGYVYVLYCGFINRLHVSGAASASFVYSDIGSTEKAVIAPLPKMGAAK